jgi:hypothetical protein
MSMKPRIGDKPHDIPGVVNQTKDVVEVGGTIVPGTVTQPKVEYCHPIPGTVSQKYEGAEKEK